MKMTTHRNCPTCGKLTPDCGHVIDIPATKTVILE